MDTITQFSRRISRSRAVIYDYIEKGQIPESCLEYVKRHGREVVEIDPGPAVEALKRNLSPLKTPGFNDVEADDREYDSFETTYFMHSVLAGMFGLDFDEKIVMSTSEEMEAHLTEALDLIGAALAGVADGDDPVSSAVNAVLLTMAGVTNRNFKVDEKEIERIKTYFRGIKNEKTNVKK